MTLLKSSAKTFTSIIANNETIVNKFFHIPSYQGVMDFWARGYNANVIHTYDTIKIDCLISPYTQLFPNTHLIMLLVGTNFILMI